MLRLTCCALFFVPVRRAVQSRDGTIRITMIVGLGGPSRVMEHFLEALMIPFWLRIESVKPALSYQVVFFRSPVDIKLVDVGPKALKIFRAI